MKFLLNVGAEKAGTTWLYEYFKQHPDYHNLGKELNLIQRDDLVPTAADVSQYKADLSLYFKHVSEINKVTGDFTHYEGSTENVYRLIKQGLAQYDIEVVPVYIMRDPIKRAWSAWNMLGGGHDFDMAVPAQFITTNYLSCKYKETIQALNSVFAKPLYFFYEDFFKQEHVDTICDALEISRQPVLQNVINRGRYNPEIPDLFIEKFCLTSKTKLAVDYVCEVFDHVPWNIEDYKKILPERGLEGSIFNRSIF